MSNLLPIPAPALQPLAQSFEYDQLETELKAAFMAVFANMIRERERNLNLYGMAHLGGDDLMASSLKADGIAMVRRNSTRMQFLMKANRSRNPRRGLLFIKRYLQAIWPNIWQSEPLWMRINDGANYPANAIPLATAVPVAAGITADYLDGSGTPTALYRTDASGRYLLYATPRTNYVRNSTLTGTVAGTPGTMPTNWVATVSGGISRQVVGSGTTNGIPYVDVRFFGTPASTALNTLSFEGNAIIPLPNGQQWTGSAFMALVAGTLTNVTSFGLGYREADAGGAATASSLTTAVALTADLTRYSVAHLNSMATTVYSNFTLRWAYANTATAVDFTVRVGLPQMEKGGVATSPILTTVAAVTVTDYSIDASGTATFASGPPPTCVYYFLTGRVRVTLPVTVDNGLGLTEIAKAFRTTLPARLMLEFKLGTQFDSSGQSGGLAFANGAVGVMPFTAIGTLQT